MSELSNTARIGLIFNGVWSQYAFATAPKYRDLYRLIYVHALTDEAVAGLDALVIPFQSNQDVLAERKDVLYRFLSEGGKIAVFGDSNPDWLDAQWEDRPVNNYWWVDDPWNPPVSQTDHTHPVFRGLTPRHACWHVHGIYTRVPEGADVIQRNAQGEPISWQTDRYGGTLFASTLDPIVEHGIQQVAHLDHFCDSLTKWLCGVEPEGKFRVDDGAYGVGRHALPVLM